MTPLPPIVDPHLHFWDLKLFPYPWLGDAGVEHLRQNYLPEHWCADAAGLDIEAIVHVQAEMDHALDPVEETRWLERIAGACETPVACVGYTDLRDPRLEDKLQEHMQSPLFRGVRQEAWFDPHSTRADVPRENFLDDPRWVAGLDRLAAHDLTFDLLIWSRQLDQASAIFRELPHLRVVLEHLGAPDIRHDDGLAQWRRSMRRFAKDVPNATLKISGLALILDQWSLELVTDLIRQAVDIFGPDRCMLASNFPVDRTVRGYRPLWEAFGSILDDLGERERCAMFGETARRTYRIQGGR